MNFPFSSSARFLKQTKFPPKRVLPLKDNPLTRWSRRLPTQWTTSTAHPTLGEVSVGLEGCESAFNATNSIRTCWFFQTGVPPTFLRVKKWEDIEHLQHRDMDQTNLGSSEAAVMDEGKEDGAADFLGAILQRDDVNAPLQEKPACGMDGLKEGTTSGGKTISGSGMALFGEENFFSPAQKSKKPIVVLENFSPSVKSIFRFRFPRNSSLVIGHENEGVQKRLILSDEQKDWTHEVSSDEKSQALSCPFPSLSLLSSSAVVCIPQYGTISSLNVVTAMGIGLFYAFLDTHFPHSRTILSGAPAISEEEKRKYAPLLEYQSCFGQALPTVTTGLNAGESTPEERRVDVRPIHPLFYKKDEKEIYELLRQHRQWLLQLSGERPQKSGGNGGSGRVCNRFGLSVLYENEFDQRNFGGLIRNCNAFLVDQLCYIGRKKYNVVGSVGSYHYTPPHYLGIGFEAAESENAAKDLNVDKGDPSSTDNGKTQKDVVRSVVENVLSEYKVDAQRQRIIRLASWSLHCREKVSNACGGPCQWWLLDCGHHPLYAEDFTYLQEELKKKKGKEKTSENSALSAPHRSSIESLRWFLTHYSDSDFVLHLTDTERKIREAAENGVVLLVPQEGKLPHISLLMQCERILSVVPPTLDGETVKTMAGLPSQVASGIALQRLSAILHPKLCHL